ncbi:MAG: hypothetical protein IJ313_01320 [Clostridia bacterium]|nr:hypothetical protein [Clostridia bacterium]
MMTDEQILALPKKAANRAEVDAMYYLGAFAKQLQQIAGDIEKRCHMVPGGWRDLKMIIKKTDGLIRMLGGTFEPEKARQIRRMGQSLRVKLEFNRQVVRENDMILVDMDELGVLIVAASQECKLRMCEPSECRKCQLGRTLDKLSWVSRDGRAWWEVFEAKMREEAEE